MKLSVLMTVFNEAKFIRQAIESCLPHADQLIIVEGSYQESINCGANPRSDDGTIEIIEDYKDDEKVVFLQANEQTDKDQRNIGLSTIKGYNPDGYLIIVDGDECYTASTFKMIRNLMKQMDKNKQYASYFTSLTFVNDLKHYTLQEFPRLFRITPSCRFVNDNFMQSDEMPTWQSPYVIKTPHIKYHHYAFCKDSDTNKKRFILKKSWWNTRFKNSNPNFQYDWYVGEDNKIWSPNHKIYEYTGKHPKIMENHPMWKENYGK